MEHGGREGRASWDYGSFVLAHPWSQSSSHVLCVDLPKVEDRFSSKTNKLACRPAFIDMGWLSCCYVAVATAVNEVGEEEDVEKLALHWEGGGGMELVRGQRGRGVSLVSSF